MQGYSFVRCHIGELRIDEKVLGKGEGRRNKWGRSGVGEIVHR